jgi:NAD+ synthase (glutamine-hydrolysing)
MVSSSIGFTPTIIRGLTLHPDNPLRFDFIIDTGHAGLDGEAFKAESTKLIKYFLASLTVPEDEVWVNLSPEEKDRIIPGSLGETQMGADMLAQDYLLKQLTASLIYPEEDLGHTFWEEVYQRVRQQYGNITIPVDMLNKVWIMPDKAVVYEHNGSVFVVERHLKVMLEEDYLLIKNQISTESKSSEMTELDQSAQVIREVMKEVVLPEIEREVNEGENFANLRQIYNAMILAAWYKKNLKESLLGKVYINKGSTKGVDAEDRDFKLKIYDQYLAALKKGVYDYIREDYDPVKKQIIPKQYFSGGEVGIKPEQLVEFKGPIHQQPEFVQQAATNPVGSDRRVDVVIVENADTKTAPSVVSRQDNSPSDRAMLSGKPSRGAIIGGTFNAFHIGDKKMAEAIKEELGIDEVVFVPANVSPHKIGEKIAPAQVRYDMVKAAIEGIPGFSVSDFDINREGPSYTIDLLEHMKTQYADGSQFFFVIGEDNVEKLSTWHRINDIQQIASFVSYTRPGYTPAESTIKVQRIVRPGIDVSATDIRQRVATGRSIRGFVDAAVEKLIQREDLYDPKSIFEDEGKTADIKSLQERVIPSDKPFMVVFDAHGTLLKSTWKDEYVLAYQKLTGKTESEGWKWVEDNIMSRIIQTTRDIRGDEILDMLKREAVLVTDREISEKDVLDAITFARQQYRDVIPAQAMPGALETVKNFKQMGMPLQVLTGADTAVVLKQLRDAGFGDYFSEENVIGNDKQQKQAQEGSPYTAREQALLRISQSNPEYRMIYFDNWIEAIRAVKMVNGIFVGVPEGNGAEFNRNYNKLAAEGMDFTVNDQRGWSKITALVDIFNNRYLDELSRKTPITKTVRVAMAQVNPKVGDLLGNFKLIVDRILEARKQNVDIIAFPELAITGYPPKDLLKKKHFVVHNKKIMEEIAPYTKGITAIIGFADIDERTGKIYNAAAVISDGEIKGIYRKNARPNYGVFDEKRYFWSGQDSQLVDLNGNALDKQIFNIDGLEFAVNICEDIWVHPDEDKVFASIEDIQEIPDPIDHAGSAVYLDQTSLGAKLLLNISSSPFREGVDYTREDLIRRRVQQTGATIIYTNMVGGEDGLIADGGSFIMNAQGKVLARGKQFEEDLVISDIAIDTVKKDEEQLANTVTLYNSVRNEKTQIDTVEIPERLSTLESAEKALIIGLRDYAKKNGFTKFVYGNSGGIDSAYVGYLAALAFGPANVTAISMPSEFNSAETISDAERAANLLGVKHMEIPIKSLYQESLDVLNRAFGGIADGVTMENLQARIRGMILMAFSNDNSGTLVGATGNKSELSVGYSTLYGDMVGGYGVIMDIFKTRVFELARYANEKAGHEIIPVSIIERAPSAELKLDQKDSDSLPDYVNLLDPILRRLVEANDSIASLSGQFSKETVAGVQRKVDIAQYKRKQFAPGTKVSTQVLEGDRRMPITNGYRETAVDEFLGKDSAMLADEDAEVEQLNKELPLGYPLRQINDKPKYTSSYVLANARSRKNFDGWADPNLDDPALSPAEKNRLMEEIRAFIQTYAPETQFVNGRPKNKKEMYMDGRGDLGWYGPNLAEDGIVLRINKDGNIEVLAGERDDYVDGLSLAGQIAKRREVGREMMGVTASKAVKREFNVDIDFRRDGVLVYQGPANDWRDTNDAWIITRGYAVLLTYEESQRLNVQAKKGMKKDSVRWVSVGEKNKFYARHRTLIDNALTKVTTQQLRTSAQKAVDVYDELTMTIEQLDEAYEAFRAGKQDFREAYDVVIPKTPHGGGYYVAAGLEETLAGIRRRRFTPDHIAAFRKTGRYTEEFLTYLSAFIFEGDISALREGTVVTADVPVMRIKASPVEMKLLQGLIMNQIAFNTNIATKTSRIVQAAKGAFVSKQDRERLIRDEGFDPVNEVRVVIDYGQRRAQEKGATAASRSAIIGGAVATSNVKAAKQHYLEPSGTMAHAFVMMFDPEDETEAFRVYAEAYPNTSVFLIDTYDTIQGAKNAIKVALEMREKGNELFGVRLDSGDLVALSKEVRKLFDDAGLSNVKIFASDDLHEDRITELLSKGARIDGFGVGTNLVTGGKQASLEMKIVKSDERRYWRVHQNRGQIQKFITTRKDRIAHAGYSEDIDEMLVPFWINGERYMDSEKPWQAHLRAEADIKRLKPDQKRLSAAALIPVEERDNPLSINTESDGMVDVDGQIAFHFLGGLPVGGAVEIVKTSRQVMDLFPKKRRFASLDKHPRGHVSLASSYNGLPAMATVLTADSIKEWTEENNPIAEHALFNLSDLHVYLEGGFRADQYAEFVNDTDGLLGELKEKGYVNQYGVKTEEFYSIDLDGFELTDKFKNQKEKIFKALKAHRGVGFQVLWTDHAVEDTGEEKLHPTKLNKEFEYIVYKGMDGKDDSYSAFQSNAGVPTELDSQIRQRGVKRLFFFGLAEDYCVGFSAINAADLGYEVYVVLDATKPVGFPPDSIANMHKEFEKRGIKMITTKELIAANQNLGVKIAARHEKSIGHPTIYEEDESSALEEDFYHLTMGQAMFKKRLHLKPATFDYFYRSAPFGEPYVIVSGVKFFLKDLTNFRFSEEQIEYLRSTGRFDEEYLQFLSEYRFKGNIYGLKEGSVAFPRESIARVDGIMFDIIIETLLLKDMNFPTLDASWANHIIVTEGEGVQRVEDGLSTAQGRAHKSASWSVFIGGFKRTTNIDAHLAYGIPLATKTDEGQFFSGDILTGGEKAAHGGVFKLSSFDDMNRIKVSGANPAKASLPGRKYSYEVVDDQGHVVDLVNGLADEKLELPVDLKAGRRQIPWVSEGGITYVVGDAFDIQAYVREQVAAYKDITQARLSPEVQREQERLILESQPKDEAMLAQDPGAEAFEAKYFDIAVPKKRERSKASFANINLLGHCNLDCRFCLGKDLQGEFDQYNNLNDHFSDWKNFKPFLTKLKEEGIKKIYITGQNTDSLLYKYLDELVDYLHQEGFFVGLRTNGILAKAKMDIINKSDSVSYTLLSQSRDKLDALVGNKTIIDWDYILRNTKTHMRVAIVVARENVDEVLDLIKFLSNFPKVTYVQLRRISTDTRLGLLKADMNEFDRLHREVAAKFKKVRTFETADIFDIHGKEVAFWATVQTTANSWNYYSNGVSSDSYFIIEGYLKNKHKIFISDSHFIARTAQPAGYPQRFPVPDNKVGWGVEYEEYNPPYFVAPVVLQQDRMKIQGGWADPEDVTTIEHKKESYEGPIVFSKNGVPLNPRGRTGIIGRGLLGKWGKNDAIDPIITRFNEETGQHEMLSVKREDGDQWGIPGVMVLDGETTEQALNRRLGQKLGLNINMAGALSLYKGYADDPRNTDNAWIETEVLHLMLPYQMTEELKSKMGDEAWVKWMPLTDENLKNMYANHGEFARLAWARLSNSVALGKSGVGNFKKKFKSFLQPGKHSLVLFDVHGVLLESEWTERYRRVYREMFGHYPSDEWIQRHVIGKMNDQIISQLVKDSGKTVKEVQGIITSVRLQERGYAIPKAMAGALEFVKALKNAGIKMMIMSGTRKEIIAPQLRERGFLEYISEDDVLGGTGDVEYDRETHVEMVQGRHPDHNIVCFDDWKDGIKKVKELGGVTLGIPEADGVARVVNRQRLLNAGVDFILENGWKDSNDIVEVLQQHETDLKDAAMLVESDAERIVRLNKKLPAGYPQRSLDNPSTYISPAVIEHSITLKYDDRQLTKERWAHPWVEEPGISFAERMERIAFIQEDIKRLAPETVFGKDGLPIFGKEQGLNGRGLFGRYGPNQTEDFGLYRFNKSGELEVLTGLRKDNGGRTLPGGFADPGQEMDIGKTAVRELKEELGVHVLPNVLKVVFEAEGEDGWCITNNAWTRQRLVAMVISYEQSLQLSPKAGDDLVEGSQQWMPVHDLPADIFSNHADLIMAGARAIEDGEVKVVDQAMLGQSDPWKKGGIDFNTVGLDLQIRRDENGIPLPLLQQPIRDMHIEGFYPVILNITPMSVPVLLGVADTEHDSHDDANLVPVFGLVDIRDKFELSKW